ncbi:MAG: acyl-CoA dehydrogenase family protein [Chloroflexi bacterium]|nr:acyl-CoA dehydrogenase family protein [Chloroflexota bacterium]
MTTILLTEEEQMLQRTVRAFAERELAPRAAQLDADPQFPWDNWRGLASLGLFGMTISPEYGGTGGTYAQLAIAIEELARACAATSVTYLAHLSLATQAVAQSGTEGQKRRWVPPMARGEKVGAFCLTEPGAGSDAAALQCSLTKRDGAYVLDGAKQFITNGSVADVLVVFATLDRSKRTRGIAAVVVEKGAPGLSAQTMHGKMGMRASDTSQVFFDGVVVPAENRLGDEGEGFKVAMGILNASRISIAAQGVGIAQAAYQEAVRYAQQREAFGGPIANLQAVQFMLADMATQVEAARLLTRQAGALKDAGLPFIRQASIAKLFATEAAVFCADRAVQILGGYGYFRPAAVERYFRDARVTTIYEGTSEVQRLVIARQILQDTAR